MADSTIGWTVDVALGVVVTLFASALVALSDVSGGIRAGVAVLYLLFVPGYGFLAALYPERQTDAERSPAARSSPFVSPGPGGVISTTARVLLTPIVSVALVGCVVLVLEFTPFGLEPRPILAAIAVTTVGCYLAAFGRRAQCSPERRGGVAFWSAFDRLRSEFVVTSRSPLTGDPEGATRYRHVAANLLVVVALVAVVASAGTMVVSDTAGQEFTEFYLVGQNETGSYTVNSVPQNFTAGESRPVFVTVTNQEGETHDYTVVSTYQRVDRTPNGTNVVSERRLATFDRRLEPGETTRFRHALEPNRSASRARVVYLLYTGDPPADPTRDNADQSVRLWISVGGRSN